MAFGRIVLGKPSVSLCVIQSTDGTDESVLVEHYRVEDVEMGLQMKVNYRGESQHFLQRSLRLPRKSLYNVESVILCVL